MSDNELTPQRTARINSERFNTELEAVWYAANYYYKTSYQRGREYIGVVFREPNGRFGITVRGDGVCFQTKVRVGDVPNGTKPTAVWHTHIPSTACATSFEGKVFMLLLTSFDFDWDEFSGDDRALSDNASKISIKRWGHRIPIYLVTATMIKRYRGNNLPDKVWHKDAPSQMRK